MSSLEKTAFITGASGGIGRGIALKLAEGGGQIAVHYFRNKSGAEETLAAVRERGSDAAESPAICAAPDR